MSSGKHSIKKDWRKTAKRITAAVVALVLVLSQTLSYATTSTAEAQDVENYITVQSNPSIRDVWDFSGNGWDDNHLHQVTGSFEGVNISTYAFCGNSTVTYPEAGTTLTDGYELGNAVIDYIVYHGWSKDNPEGSNDPSGTNSYKISTGYTDDTDEAVFQMLTQALIWEYALEYNLYSYDSSEAARIQTIINSLCEWSGVKEVYEALKADAENYAKAGGGGDEEGCAIWWPNADGTQPLITGVPRSKRNGTIKIQKTLEDADAYLGVYSSSNYSLEGAMYTVYSDESCTTAVKTITIAYDESSGTWSGTVDVSAGTYYVKETNSAYNCNLDDTVYTCVVTASSTTYYADGVELSGLDYIPSVEPLGTMCILVSKLTWDTTTGSYSEIYPVGAIYGVYASEDDAESGENLITTITIGADGTGVSDALLINTYYVKEISAPDTFALDSKIYSADVTADGIAIVNGSTAYVESNDELALGELSLTKKDALIGDGLAGTTFRLYNMTGTWAYIATSAVNDTSIVINSEAIDTSIGDDGIVTDVSGTTYYAVTGADASLWILELTTGEDGTVSTGEHSISEGTYLLQEYAAPTDYELDPEWAEGQIIDISDSVSTTYTAEDLPTLGGFSLQKKIEQTGETAAYGSSSIEGVTFTVTNSSGKIVYVPASADESEGIALYPEDGSTTFDGVTYYAYDDGSLIMTLTTNAEGSTTTGDVLPYGTYTVCETSVPAGLELDEAWSQGVTITVSTSSAESTYDVDNPLVFISVEVDKTDAEAGESSAQGDATLEDAVFTIYMSADYADDVTVLVDESAISEGAALLTENASEVITYDGISYYAFSNANDADTSDELGVAIMTLTTDESGHAESGTCLSYADYVIEETGTPSGYVLNDEWSSAVNMASDKTTFSLEVSNEVIRGGLTLTKLDFESETNIALGSASLEGAQLTVTNVSESYVLMAFDATTLEECTDEQGNLHVFDANGELLYELIDIENHSVVYDEDDNAYLCYGSGDDMLLLYTDETGTATLAGDILPYGSYTISETAASRGYLLNEDGTSTWEATVYIREDGVIVDLNSTESYVDSEADSNGTSCWTFSGEAYADESDSFDSDTNALLIYNRVKRGDLAFSKKYEGEERVAYATFVLTSQSTGEWHVLVADENGMINTSSSWNARTSTTNANDALVEYNDATGEWEVTDEELLDATVGVWFYGITADAFDGDTNAYNAAIANIGINDLLGALPYDVYTLQEVRSPANEDYELVTTTITITREGVTIDYGTIDDPEFESPELSTELVWSDDEDSRTVPATEELTLTDTVWYSNLDNGSTYTLESEIVAFDADGTKLETLAKKTSTFTAKGSNNDVSITLTVNTTDLEGCSIVAYETVYDEDGELVAKHADSSDADQTLWIPSIDSELIADQTQSHTAPAVNGTTVTDTLTLTNLFVGETYIVSDSLMLTSEEVVADSEDISIASAETTVSELLDSDGNAYVQKNEFTATDTTMTVTLTHELANAEDWAGSSVVAYATLATKSGTVVASHLDANDPDQTVTFPSVETTALNAETGTSDTPQTADQTLVDTVWLTGLTVGTEYTVTGSVHLVDHDADGKKIDGGVLSDENGDEVVGSVTFTATAEEMELQVAFDYDASELGGYDVVAFEALYQGDVLLAFHYDIEDDGQTNNVPTGATELLVNSTGSHTLPNDGTQTLTDTVVLVNLTAGSEYSVTGTLHVQAVDENGAVYDAGVLTDADGNTITSTVSFVATDETMEIAVEFTIDASDLAGTTLVAFEEVTDPNGVWLTSHEDIEDASQSVSSPAIDSTLTDSDNSHTASTEDGTVVTDTVTLTNLMIGETYTITDLLVLLGDEPATANNAEGEAYSQTQTFTASSTTETLTFEHVLTNASNFAGSSIVAFATVASDNDTIVATHEDLADADQTITFPTVQTEATSGTTDDHYGAAVSTETIEDSVSLAGLTVGETYTVSGTLHYVSFDESGNKIDGGTVTTSEGDEVTAETTFTAEAESATVTLTFEVDATQFGGQTVVAFETLRRGEHELATHWDINDEDQSVDYPSLGTTATDASDGDHTLLTGEQTVTDVVALSNLEVGETYTVAGQLWVVAWDDDGYAYANVAATESESVTFTADAESMEVTVSFIFDATDWYSESLVAFETLYDANGTVVAEHADASDEDQTVHVEGSPEIGTTLHYGDSHEIQAGTYDSVALTDIVRYEDFEIGETYTITGVLHTVAYDEEGNPYDGGELTDADGTIITSEITFTAEEACGSVEVTFMLGNFTLETGEAMVAYEYAYDSEDELVASHEDISDAGQTITVIEPEETSTTSEYPNTGQGPWAFLLLASGVVLISTAIMLYRRSRSRAGRHYRRS